VLSRGADRPGCVTSHVTWSRYSLLVCARRATYRQEVAGRYRQAAERQPPRATPRSSAPSTPSCAGAVSTAAAETALDSITESTPATTLHTPSMPAAGRLRHPPDPLHPERRLQPRGPLEMGFNQPGPTGGAARGAEAETKPTNRRGSSTDPQRGVEGRRLGHADLARHDDRRPTGRAVRPKMATRRSGPKCPLRITGPLVNTAQRPGRRTPRTVNSAAWSWTPRPSPSLRNIENAAENAAKRSAPPWLGRCSCSPQRLTAGYISSLP
jgi:hypothetical protein